MYNPIEGWGQTVISRFAELRAEWEDRGELFLTIVNDGSQTRNIESGRKVITGSLPGVTWIGYPQNRGKGYALRQGVKATDAPFIIYTDIDFPYTNESILKIMTHLVTGKYEAVVGIRDDSYYDNLPTSRRWISHILRQLNAFFLGLKISDTQGGLKGFTGEVREVFLKTRIERYLFDLEFIYLLSKRKSSRLLPVQVKLRDGVEFSKIRMSILLNEFKNFLRVLLVSK